VADDSSTRFRETALVVRRGFESGAVLGLRLPWVEIHAREAGAPDEDLSGIGDLALFGEHPLVGGLSGLAGLKLPTGEEKESPRPGVIPPSLLQVSTGTFDPFVGLRWVTAEDGVMWSASGIWQFPLGESDAELKPGQVLQLQAGGAYALNEEWSAGLGVEAMFRGKDQLQGADLGMTGSSIWSVTPTLAWALSDHTQLDLLARIPVDTQVDHVQVVPGPLFLVGVTWRF
jgi:hypothetical protein